MHSDINLILVENLYSPNKLELNCYLHEAFLKICGVKSCYNEVGEKSPTQSGALPKRLKGSHLKCDRRQGCRAWVQILHAPFTQCFTTNFALGHMAYPFELFQPISKPIKRTLTMWEVHNYGRWTRLYLCGRLIQSLVVAIKVTLF